MRCKNCGTPIFIDPSEESEPPAGAGVSSAPPASPVIGGPEPEPGPALVVCPDCEARYRVPADALGRRGLKLKCSQCGRVFEPPAEYRAPTPPPVAPERAGPELYPRAAQEPEGTGQEMPVPDDRRMEHMFDDLQVDAPAGAPTGPELPEPPPLRPEDELGRIADSVFAEEGEEGEEEVSPESPEEAYLHAVDFQEEEEPVPEPPGRRAVPDDQKYRFFLNPKDFQEGGGAEEEMPPLPDEFESDLTAPPAAPSPGGEAGDPAAQAPGPPEPPAADTPPTEMPMEDLPPLPTAGETAATLPSTEFARTRTPVPGQEPSVPRESRSQLMFVAAAAVILIGAGIWGYWLATTPGRPAPYVVQQGVTHQLALEQKLQGHYVDNKPSGKRLFVVTGALENRFPASSRLRWIRIKGVAYADVGQTQALGTVFAYVGNQLDTGQLATWDLEAIRAYYGYTNGRKDENYDIPSGSKVPFQLVFTNLSAPVQRTVAQVVSYTLDGQSVFIDLP